MPTRYYNSAEDQPSCSDRAERGGIVQAGGQQSLKPGDTGSEQNAKLICQSRKKAADFARRQLCQMSGNYAPRTLHHELHQERADRQPDQGV